MTAWRFSPSTANRHADPKENVPSGGRTPRNIRFDPSGNWFFAANENGGNITEFKVDKTSGHLTPTGVTGADQHAGRNVFFEGEVISLRRVFGEMVRLSPYSGVNHNVSNQSGNMVEFIEIELKV